MKKIIMGLAIIGFIGFFALQQAYAGRGRNMNSGPGCPAWDCGFSQSQNNIPQKDIDAFLQATVDLRKHLAMKQAEYQALMNSKILILLKHLPLLERFFNSVIKSEPRPKRRELETVIVVPVMAVGADGETASVLAAEGEIAGDLIIDSQSVTLKTINLPEQDSRRWFQPAGEELSNSRMIKGEFPK